jgi:transcriptional regulator with XRE-family HTH domain
MTSLHIIILRRLEKILNNKSEDRKNKKEAKSKGMKINMKEKFINLRKGLKLNQKQIAEYLDVDQSYISKCEKGERQFSVDIIEKVAELFGCTVDYFVKESCEFAEMPIALRAKSVTTEDLNTIAAINKIALNLRFMEGLLAREE